MIRTIGWFVPVVLGAGAGAGGTTFSVSFDATLRAEPATGRLVVYLIGEGARGLASREPADGPFWETLQPMFGVDVRGLAPGAPAVVDDGATSMPAPPSALPPGKYRAQAVLDVDRRSSRWRDEPGNLFSEPVEFSVEAGKGARVGIRLTKVVQEELPAAGAGADLFELRSTLLSAFAGRDVVLRCGVAVPTGRDPARAYAAVYEVPGFGGTWRSVFNPGHPWRRRLALGSPLVSLRESAFWIALDCESGNGPTLFADSENNGPWGRALVEELVPALEKKYNLVAAPSARILRGHSTGGWSTLWLALTHPETFGACWSSSPDPVDFRRFQLVDIYAGGSMYAPPADAPAGTPAAWLRDGYPSYRRMGVERMTIRQENTSEEVLGPDNSSGQQWDSWQAVFGPRNSAGNPAALFDPVTGAIDPEIASRMRAYDIGERLRAEPGVLGPIFHQRVRLVVGALDNFYLNEAVSLLKADVDRLTFTEYPEGKHGYVKVLAGYDHGTVTASPEVRAFDGEMLDHLRRSGHAPAAK